jgi:hypothetical protein
MLSNPETINAAKLVVDKNAYSYLFPLYLSLDTVSDAFRCYGNSSLFKTEAKYDEMGRACSTNGEKQNGCRLFVVTPEGKRPFGGPVRRWVDNIKIVWRDKMGLCGLDCSGSG